MSFSLSKTARSKKAFVLKLSGCLNHLGYIFLLLAISYSIYEAVRGNQVAERCEETFRGANWILDGTDWTRRYDEVCQDIEMTTEAVVWNFGDKFANIYCASKSYHNSTDDDISRIPPPCSILSEVQPDSSEVEYCYSDLTARSSADCVEWETYKTEYSGWMVCWPKPFESEKPWFLRMVLAAPLPAEVPMECKLFSKLSIKANFIMRAVIEPLLLMSTLVQQRYWIPMGSPVTALFVPSGGISFSIQMLGAISVAFLTVQLLLPGVSIDFGLLDIDKGTSNPVSNLASVSLALWVVYALVCTFRMAYALSTRTSIFTTRLAAFLGVLALLVWDIALATLSYRTGSNWWIFLLVAADVAMVMLELAALYTSSGSWYDSNRSGSLYVGALDYCSKEGKSIRKRLEKLTWKGKVVLMLPSMLGSEVTASVLADVAKELREGPLVGQSWYNELDSQGRTDARFKAALYVPAQTDKKSIFLKDGAAYIETDIGTLKIDPATGKAEKVQDPSDVDEKAKNKIDPMLLRDS